MDKNRLKRIFRPSWRVVIGAVILLVAGNIVGKVLAPNGPSGDVKGVLGTIGMAVFFILLVYLVVVAIVGVIAVLKRAASRRRRASRS
jgi:uncharacterized membrane protein